MTAGDQRDFSERDPDRIVGAAETLERAQQRQPGQFPPVSPRDLFSGIRPPGPTEVQVSRTPGSNMAPGVEVAGATHRVAGTRGSAEEFPTIGGARTTALVRNLVSTGRYQAAVHVRRGAGPDDPPVVVDPAQGDGEVPAGMRDAIGYDTTAHATGDDGRPAQQTVRRV